MSLNEFESQLTKEQKTGFVLLLLFAVLTVALGFLQLRNTIYSPFVIRLSQKEKTIEIQDEATRLQAIDTDRDGLNDYDEITFYQTSAYLPDTDSDGKTDKQEIDAKTNPLCAEGQICDVSDLPEANSAEKELTEKANKTQTPLDITGGSLSNTTDVSVQPQPASGVPDINALLNDPKQLRTYLLGTGKITEQQLSQIDDATLIENFKAAYQQTAAEQPGSASSSTKTSSP